MPGEARKTGSSNIKSQVPKVLLNLNPGLNRQLNTQLEMLEKLKLKAERTADQRRHRFVMDFETRRNRRDRLYSRITKMDDDTRRAIDRYKPPNFKSEHRYSINNGRRVTVCL